MGVGDEIPGGPRAARGQGGTARRGPARLGRPGPVRRGDDRRPRLRAPRQSARLQPAPARLRTGRRHDHRQLQQVRVQPGAVHPVPGEGRQPAGDRRELEGGACRSRSIRCSTLPTALPTPTGRGGARSAASTSSSPPTRTTRISSSSRSPSPTTRGPSAARWSKPRSARADRSLYSGVGLWRQLPAGTDGAYRLMANLISLGSADHAERRRQRAKSNPGARPPVQPSTRRAGRGSGAAGMTAEGWVG